MAREMTKAQMAIVIEQLRAENATLRLMLGDLRAQKAPSTTPMRVAMAQARQVAMATGKTTPVRRPS